MGVRLFLAGDDGLYVLDEGDEGWVEVGRHLEGHAVTAVSASRYAILAGTRKDGYLSRDPGVSWAGASRGLAEPHVRWLSYHLDDPWLAFAGTEPAAIFVSEDGLRSPDRARRSHPTGSSTGCCPGSQGEGERGLGCAGGGNRDLAGRHVPGAG